MLQGNEGGTERARRLRREMSLPEILLWRELKRRPGGLKFRKQHPSGPFTADFYCHEARLVVEVDGAAHDMGNNPRSDAERDAWFARRKIDVFRIAARDVLANLDGVLTAIAARGAGRLQG